MTCSLIVDCSALILAGLDHCAQEAQTGTSKILFEEEKRVVPAFLRLNAEYVAL